MPFPVPSPLRALAVASLLVLALGACGRRGALEAPPDPRAPAAPAAASANAGGAPAPRSADGISAGEDVTDDGDERGAIPSVIPAPRRRARNITIPKEPFILDPLL